MMSLAANKYSKEQSGQRKESVEEGGVGWDYKTGNRDEKKQKYTHLPILFKM